MERDGLQSSTILPNDGKRIQEGRLVFRVLENMLEKSFLGEIWRIKSTTRRTGRPSKKILKMIHLVKWTAISDYESMKLPASVVTLGSKTVADRHPRGIILPEIRLMEELSCFHKFPQQFLLAPG
jgi:hypothetical protein